MTEGGLLHWKIQKIKYGNGPPADYSQVLSPLPDPPKGMIWNKDEATGEWSIIEKQKAVDKSRLDDNNNNNNDDDDDDNDDDEWELLDSEGNKSKTKKVEVSYVEHLVLPTDTFEGICLNYKISPIKLRQVNKFSGSNLVLAPKKLKIPIDGKNIIEIKIQDQNSPTFKMHTLIHEFPKLSQSEAKAYLEIADWDVDAARKDIKDDFDWELKHLDSTKSVCNHNVHLEVHEGVPVATANSATLKTFTQKELEMRILL